MCVCIPHPFFFTHYYYLVGEQTSVHPESYAKLLETQLFGCPYCTARFISRDDCATHMRGCESAPAQPVTPFVKTGIFTDNLGPPPIFYGTQSVLSWHRLCLKVEHVCKHPFTVKKFTWRESIYILLLFVSLFDI